MDVNQLIMLLSRLTPDNKQQIWRYIQLSAAQEGQQVSPELQQFFTAPEGANQDELFNNVLNSLKPEEQPTGLGGLSSSLMGQGQFGFAPHLSSLENILSRLEGGQNQSMNASNRFTGMNQGSSYKAGAQQNAQPKGWGTWALNKLGTATDIAAPLIGAGVGGYLGGPGGATAGYGLGQSIGRLGRLGENYGNNPMYAQHRGY